MGFEVLNMQPTMPRPPSDKTFQVAFKIPDEWVEMADELAKKMSSPGMTVTRTDVLRTALWEGLTKMRDAKGGRK